MTGNAVRWPAPQIVSTALITCCRAGRPKHEHLHSPSRRVGSTRWMQGLRPHGTSHELQPHQLWLMVIGLIGILVIFQVFTSESYRHHHNRRRCPTERRQHLLYVLERELSGRLLLTQQCRRMHRGSMTKTQGAIPYTLAPVIVTQAPNGSTPSRNYGNRPHARLQAGDVAPSIAGTIRFNELATHSVARWHTAEGCWLRSPLYPRRL
jgi:hypothetical protein